MACYFFLLTGCKGNVAVNVGYSIKEVHATSPMLHVMSDVCYRKHTNIIDNVCYRIRDKHYG